MATVRGTWLAVVATIVGTALAAAVAHASSRADAVDVGPGIQPPRLEGEARVRYPQSVLVDRIFGTVVLRVRIDTRGRVRESEVVSSPDKRLSEAARDIVADRRYAPATKDGQPIAVWWQTEVNFPPLPTEAELDTLCESITPTKAAPIEVEAADELPRLIKKAPLGALSSSKKWVGKPMIRPGYANVRCVIDVCGRIKDCVALKSTGEAYTDVAVASVTQWRFTPARKNGQPVPVFYELRVTWR